MDLRRACLMLSVVMALGAGCGDDAVTSGGDAGQDSGMAPVITDSGAPPMMTPDAGPGPTRTSTPEQIAMVCDFFVTCDTIPGPTLTKAYCEREVLDPCVECVGMQAMDLDAGTLTDAGASADQCAQGMANQAACQEQCSVLVQPPTTVDECVDIASSDNSSGAGMKSDPMCLCENCMMEFANCIADDLCWAVVQCANRVGCSGIDCFTGGCMEPILAAGATSLSVTMAQELGDCVANMGCRM